MTSASARSACAIGPIRLAGLGSTMNASAPPGLRVDAYINDSDWACYRLKKEFNDIWSSLDKWRLPGRSAGTRERARSHRSAGLSRAGLVRNPSSSAFAGAIPKRVSRTPAAIGRL
jgi:hypothetical protein